MFSWCGVVCGGLWFLLLGLLVAFREVSCVFWSEVSCVFWCEVLCFLLFFLYRDTVYIEHMPSPMSANPGRHMHSPFSSYA